MKSKRDSKKLPPSTSSSDAASPAEPGLVEDLDALATAFGGDRAAAEALGLAPRSWQRWRAGDAIAAFARRSIQLLAAAGRVLDLRAVSRGESPVEAFASLQLTAEPEPSRAAARRKERDAAVLPSRDDDGPRPIRGPESVQLEGNTRGPAPLRPAAARRGFLETLHRALTGSDVDVVRVRMHDGEVTSVSAARAARLLEAREASPCDDWTVAEARAVVAAAEARQARQVERLRADGLLIDGETETAASAAIRGRARWMK